MAYLEPDIDGNMYEIPRPVRCKNRENHTPKKNNHTQNSIYVVWQFAYVYGVAEISLFSGKNTKCDNTVFLSKKQHQNPNLQNNSFLFYA